MTELLYPESRGYQRLGLTRQCSYRRLSAVQGAPMQLHGAPAPSGLVIFYLAFYLALYALARSHVAALNHCLWVGGFYFRMSRRWPTVKNS